MLRSPMLRFLRLQGAVALVLVLEPACRKRQVAIPVQPHPAAASQPHAVSPPAPVQDTGAPQAAPAITTTTNVQTTPYQVNKPAPAQPSAPRKPARAVAAPSPQATAPVPSPAPAPPAPITPPQLVDIVPPDQQRQLNGAIDQSLARAQASLTSIASRELSKDQQAMADQIRNLMQQAQVSRKSDLQGAKSLAERAEVLAKDLAGSFQ